MILPFILRLCNPSTTREARVAEFTPGRLVLNTSTRLTARHDLLRFSIAVVYVGPLAYAVRSAFEPF